MHAEKGAILAKIFRIWKLFWFTHMLNLMRPLKLLSGVGLNRVQVNIPDVAWMS